MIIVILSIFDEVKSSYAGNKKVARHLFVR